jgi:hypothetical protein
MKGDFCIRLLLIRVRDGQATLRDIDPLVQRLKGHGMFLLQTRNKRAVQRLSARGYALADIALRSVEHLVLEKNGIRCYRLQRYLAATFPPSCEPTDGDADNALARVMHISVQDTLADLLSESDPEYSRIRRTVLGHLRSDADFRIEHSVRGLLVSRAGDGVRGPWREEAPTDVLLARLIRSVPFTSSIRVLVRELFLVLAEASEYDSCLPLGSIVGAIHQYFRIYHAAEHADDTVVDTYNDDERVDHIRCKTVEAVRSTLLTRYEQRSILSRDEVGRMEEALAAFLDDFAQQQQRPLFEYFRQLYPDADYSAYRCRERNRFEYIMQVGRDAFCRECARVLLP